MPHIASVVVGIEHSSVDREYDYLIPPHLMSIVQPGVQVVVPFGRAKTTAFVVNIKDTSSISADRLRVILQVLHGGETMITPDLIIVARQLAGYYQVPLAAALACLVPAGATGVKRVVKPKKEQVVRLCSQRDHSVLSLKLSCAPKQLAIVSVLNSVSEMKVSDLLRIADAPRSSLRALEKKGIVKIALRERLRNPLSSKQSLYNDQASVQPTEWQKRAIDRIISAMNNCESSPILVHGVTGSGKTEVYLNCLQRCIGTSRQGILLVPEISLTPQMVDLLVQRFGNDVAVLHSSLSLGERYDEWRRIKRGDAKIVVGARSAVFAPCSNLGLIIIDEEHESTYKQEDGVRYHARTVASWRAKYWKIPLVLGSATPAIESFYGAESGKYALVSLPYRVGKRPLPAVDVVDMREELRAGHKSIFSRLLINKLDECFRRGDKVILFLNRRGFSSFVMCRKCGYVCKCDSCEVSLTYHANTHRLHCHYCQTTRKVPQVCPECNSKAIRYFGAGTEAVEKEVTKLFPLAKTIRMDSDTTRNKGAHEELLRSFRTGPSNVLVGTQMIAKGLDIHDVTLVGVISADTSLHLPDFRAGERTFQLLTQVAGRAGRGERPGNVVVQTYTPNSFAIQTAIEHDYSGFYASEIANRKDFGYPPFGQLINITCSHIEERVARRGVIFLARQLESYELSFSVLGPAPSPLAKVRNLYRWHIVLKLKSVEGVWPLVRNTVDELRRRASKLAHPLRVAVDVDPQSVL